MGGVREYRDVTPLSWGEQYHAKIFVSREALRLIEARGGGALTAERLGSRLLASTLFLLAQGHAELYSDAPRDHESR